MGAAAAAGRARRRATRAQDAGGRPHRCPLAPGVEVTANAESMRCPERRPSDSAKCFSPNPPPSRISVEGERQANDVAARLAREIRALGAADARALDGSLSPAPSCGRCSCGSTGRLRRERRAPEDRPRHGPAGGRRGARVHAVAVADHDRRVSTSETTPLGLRSAARATARQAKHCHAGPRRSGCGRSPSSAPRSASKCAGADN